MTPQLVEGKYGHGAKFVSAAHHMKVHGKRSFIGESSVPYDWSKPLIRNYTQPVKNQFQASMCGGEMYSQAEQIYRTLVLGLPFEELSEISFYSQQFDPTEGMSIQEVQNGAAFTGLTSYANVPTPINCTESQAESLSWRTPATISDCLMKAGMQMVSVPIDINSIAAAIRDHYFVGWMISGQNNGTWLSSTPLPPISNQNLWTHYMCSRPSIDAGVPRIPMYQSWGSDVGDNGVQYFDQNYIDSGYIYDVFTFVRFVYNNNLQVGSFGTDVKYLQIKLGMQSNTLGFGMFGPKTLAAVKAYQAAHNISATGYVGPLTRASLNS